MIKDEYNRFEEKQNYIKIRLKEIHQTFKDANKKDISLKIFDDETSFNIIAVATILKEKDFEFKFHPDDHIKKLDKKFKQLNEIIF